MGDTINKDEMRGEYGKYEGKEKRMPDFGGENVKNEATRKTKA